MKPMLVYPVGSTAACRYGADFLESFSVPLVDHPAPEVTHLLLDVPSFGPDGALRGGGDVREILRMLPPEITVVGGNLNHAALDSYEKLDLLKDAEYLAVNAAITAECALQTAAEKMDTIFAGTPVLILGWGRIGKSLGQLLKALGADVTVAARKEADRALLKMLGYRAVDMTQQKPVLPGCRVVFNTVPEMILPKALTCICKNCLFLDLASKPGIEAENAIWARGLPGILAPESSGQLIADTFLRLSGRD